MRIKETIESKLQILQPEFLEVINESQNHNVPPGSESHFKATVVSEAFQGKMLVARHRMVNDILADELAQSIHALALHTMTMEEWFKKGGTSTASPPCLGGSASEGNKR
ncbi:BolA family protein [Candidatus Nitrotoga sp. M5]|uniref:BolA family protein n=1 Tax=Candidatus Nitrotoga sp. M5 TaxID=2890409 RepID=UPI001EF1806D|nr:BolA/IbaG family iron-sulfur metabolism protein [Candidatus Nitrotoga sp. M5]CAH1385242.1 DNA-binding transcriptional dual regulator BolA [Candidatus Nitrotoga sp. M5]